MMQMKRAPKGAKNLHGFHTMWKNLKKIRMKMHVTPMMYLIRERGRGMDIVRQETTQLQEGMGAIHPGKTPAKITSYPLTLANGTGGCH